MAEIKAAPAAPAVPDRCDKPFTLKLHNWAQQNCIPIEYIYTDDINKKDRAERWACSIGIIDKEGVFGRKTGPTKTVAKEHAAAEFFKIKANEAILKRYESLPAPTLEALCAQLSIPSFRIESDQLDPGQMALTKAMMVVGAIKDSTGDKVHYQSRARLAKKQANRTLAISDYWSQCTISHVLWAPGTRVVGAGRTIKDAVRNTSVRVLRQCMDDERMFKRLVMPDAPTLKSVNDIFIGGVGDDKHRVWYSEYCSSGDLEIAFDKLGKSTALGLDTEHITDSETKQPRLATVQLTGDDFTLVFQDHKKMPLRDRLAAILKNPKQIKFVVDLPRERAVLQAAGFELRGAIDLQVEAKKYPQFGDKASLVVMAARLCHLKLDRDSKIRQSDWAAVPLSKEQVHYAGLDSFTTLIVGLSFQARAKSAPSDPMFLRWDPEEKKKTV